jgi:mono/diheme cytochrome c family protein
LGTLRVEFPVAILLVASAIAVRGPITLADETRVEFNRQIRPLLSDRCFRCHGPDARQRKADLRLDTVDGATAKRDGTPAIVPRDSAASELIRRVATDDETERMPPPGAGKALSPDEVQLLRRWVEQGAEYQPVWSLIAPQRLAIPSVNDTAWANGLNFNTITGMTWKSYLLPVRGAGAAWFRLHVYLDTAHRRERVVLTHGTGGDDVLVRIQRERLLERFPLRAPKLRRRWDEAVARIVDHGRGVTLFADDGEDLHDVVGPLVGAHLLGRRPIPLGLDADEHADVKLLGRTLSRT